ncbi:ras-related protein Rab-32B-like [Chrysoperla carnea]|uniref:ras-related protein Rab-32B-like n=1 Tax=Chrysoperla carnea TaxID=189513 RepID=UPI001D06280A|nr:ras-related protein Rab-32B-like [Chrysoperla carnea]
MQVKNADFKNNYPQKELLLKFLVIGEFGVGKTAIVRRYTEGKFSSNYKITIGADFAIKSILWDSDTRINLQLWDIAGHERFGYMTRVYYKYAVGACVVFDLSRVATLYAVDKWVSDLREKICLPNDQPVPIILLANKSDIQGCSIPSDAIAKICKDNGIAAWYITSAKDNSNIEQAFNHLMEIAMENEQTSYENKPDKNGIILKDNNKGVVSNNLKPNCCN